MSLSHNIFVLLFLKTASYKTVLHPCEGYGLIPEHPKLLLGSERYAQSPLWHWCCNQPATNASWH